MYIYQPLGKFNEPIPSILEIDFSLRAFTNMDHVLMAKQNFQICPSQF